MIISVRGTSGSGKTHLVRRVKALYDNWETVVEFGKIVGYANPKLFIFGDYRDSLQSAGADSIKWGKFAHREHRMTFLRNWAVHYNVLFEGLMESNEVGRTAVWNKQVPVHVVFLDTPLEECLAYVNRRRAARGVVDPVNPYKTTVKHQELLRVHARLGNVGVDSRRLDREQAYRWVCQLLGHA